MSRGSNIAARQAGARQLAADLTDPIVLLTLAQTVVLTLTMVVFILPFRNQNLAIGDAAYQKALDDYTPQSLC